MISQLLVNFIPDHATKHQHFIVSNFRKTFHLFLEYGELPALPIDQIMSTMTSSECGLPQALLIRFSKNSEALPKESAKFSAKHMSPNLSQTPAMAHTELFQAWNPHIGNIYKDWRSLL